MKTKNAWLCQLITIANKGHAAFLRGEPLDGNPYTSRRGLSGQRATAWREGWLCAKRETLNPIPSLPQDLADRWG